MSRKQQRNKSRPAIRFEAADDVLSADSHGAPNTVPAFMRGAPDRSTAPPARIATHRPAPAGMEHSQRFRPPTAQQVPAVEVESPVRVTTKPVEYHHSSFLRSVSSRLSKR